MELKTVEVEGFKRFGERAHLRLESKLVALVGPNEAGKTSLLTAISRHADGAKFQENDASNFVSTTPQVTLKYFISADEAADFGLDGPSWLAVKRDAANAKVAEIVPSPRRDVSGREACAASLDKLMRFSSKSTDASWPSKELYIELQALLSSSQAYSQAQIAKLQDALTKLAEYNGQFSTPVDGEDDGVSESDRDEDHRTASLNTERILRQTIEFEAGHDPTREAIEAVMSQVPPILEFTEADRELELPYAIRSFRNQDPKQRKLPSKPLSDLMRLTGLDLEALIDADTSNASSIVRGLIEEANEKLRELSEGLWSQSDARIEFNLDKSRLDIMVVHGRRFETKFKYNTLAERSAGYRQFIALNIFSLFHDLDGAILLIDEMEQHLHYDAQADLIQMLTREPRLSKVIYSTHSLGCLPEDLGAGVKLVQWDSDDPKQSRIVNRFWGRGRTDGFSPLLFGMGATTLSFFPTRRALIAEGITETLLLPRLLREAMEVDRLDFQVVHGLSNLSPTGIPMVDTTARRVAYLVDNDEGGTAIRAGLIGVGVPPTQILRIADGSSLKTLEDLIDEEVWLRAVNAVQHEISGAGGTAEEFTNAPAIGRVDALPETLQRRKADLAYAVLDIAFDAPATRLVSPNHLGALKNLGQAAHAALEI